MHIEVTASVNRARGALNILGARAPFYGWVIVGIAMLATFSSGPGQSYLFSVFIDSMIADTGFSRTQISTLYAAGTFVSAGMVMLISRVADRRGPRFSLTMIAALFGLACFGMSVATGALVFALALASLRGLGQGALPINGTLLIAQWFVRKRGRAMAVAGLGGAASTAILPQVARALIENIGWRETYAVFGIAIWVVVIPVALLLVRNRPEDVGLYPDNASHPPHGERVATPGVPDRRPILTSRMFWLLVIPMSMPSLVDTALIFHQASIFRERGLDASIAAAAFAPMALATALSGFAAGFFIDRLDPRRVYVVALGLAILPPLLALVISSPAMALGYGLLLGFASGMSMMVSRVAWAHYYGRVGLGRVQGTAMMVTIVGSALGPVLLAFLRDQSTTYTPALLLMSSLYIVGLAITILHRPQPVHLS